MKNLTSKIITYFVVILSTHHLRTEAGRQHVFQGLDSTLLLAAGILTLLLTDGNPSFNGLSKYDYRPPAIVIPVPVKGAISRSTLSNIPYTSRTLNPFSRHSYLNILPTKFSKYGLGLGLRHKYLDEDFSTIDKIDWTDISDIFDGYTFGADNLNLLHNLDFGNSQSTKIPFLNVESEFLDSSKLPLLYNSFLNEM